MVPRRDLHVGSVFQRSLYPGSITGWHAHAVTVDRLFCSVGTVRISLYDGRVASPSFGNAWHKICGPLRPAIVTVPPGVWHGIACLGPETALVLNLVDKAYSYTAPDHWRLPPDTDQIPHKLVRCAAVPDSAMTTGRTARLGSDRDPQPARGAKSGDQERHRPDPAGLGNARGRRRMPTDTPAAVAGVRRSAHVYIAASNLPVNVGEQSGPNNSGLPGLAAATSRCSTMTISGFPIHLSALSGWIDATGADIAFSRGAVLEPTANLTSRTMLTRFMVEDCVGLTIRP